MWVAKNGTTFEPIAEFRNSWGGASYVWSAICAKIFGDPQRWLFKAEELWPLYKDARLTDVERITLASTFDRVLVRAEEGKRLASILRAFVEAHPPEKGQACNLLDQAAILEAVEPGAVIGWQQTTVSPSHWGRHYDYNQDDECEDEEGWLYDLSLQTDHYFLFDEIARHLRSESI